MKEKYLYVTTVDKLAELISQYLDYDTIWQSNIPTIDFCTVDVERKPFYSDAEIQQLRQRAEGWYGIAKVEFPFNSSTLFLMADYYGGGAEELIRLYDGIDKDEAANKIMDHILDCLQTNEGNGFIADTLILVESAEQLNLPRSVWMRLGVNLKVTPNELEVLLGDNEDEATDLLRKIIAENRFVADGDSYIPSQVVTDLNSKFGTRYNDKMDVGFDL